MKMEISKQDWLLFREKVPQWQENYMDRLNREYIDLLSADRPASEKFWALEERIKEDSKRPGAILEFRKRDVAYQIAVMLYDKAIPAEDLEGFSDELKDAVNLFLNER